MTQGNRRFLLRERPAGRVEDGHFDFVETPVPEPSDGQALVRILYLSLDPTNRLWMSDRDQYMAPVALGEVMRGIGLGVVVKSRSARYAEGQLVSGLLGWQDYCLIGDGAAQVQRLAGHPGIPLPAFLGVCGPTGLTAYFGMLDIGQAKSGDTVIVSAAAGAVGSVAGQIARIKGCRTIGIAGGEAKCRHVVERYGFDSAVDYKAADFGARLEAATPDGVDIDFENVGGAMMDSVLARMNPGGRVALCGMISGYNDPDRMPGDFAMILMRRLTVRGFIVSDFMRQFPAATQQLAEWVLDGEIRYDETIVEGLEHAPAAINRLFDGGNVGKLVIQLVDQAETPE